MARTISRRRPQPVAIAQAVSSAIPVLLGLAVSVGVIDLTPEQVAGASSSADNVIAAALTTVTAAVALVSTVRARGRVTPVVDPRTDRGVALVPERTIID